MTHCVNLQDLSTDSILAILSFLDVGTISKFGATCENYHKIVPFVDLWGRRFHAVWPQEKLQPRAGVLMQALYKRELFRRARPRFDGSYVSRCVYSRRIQEGASLTDTRTFLQIVYHRLIRFLPDKTALMIISEKGGKGSSRQVFQDLANSDVDPHLLEKYGKQLHRCRWELKSESEEGAMLSLSYFDGKLCWSADLLACPGTDRRQGGSRLEWYEYRFWDPSEVLDFRRRELYREREAVNHRLHRAQIDSTDLDTLSDLMYQYEQLGEALRAVRESHTDPVDSIPPMLLKRITLCQEHFPLSRLVHSSKLAHLF